MITTGHVAFSEPTGIVSVDDHLIEPPDLWVNRLPSKYLDVGPRVERSDAGEAWIYEDTRIQTGGLTAVVGRSRTDWSPEAISYDELHPGAYKPKARVEDMDIAGILAQTLFPSYPRFCGQIFAEATDKELALLCVRAWNDHVIEEWSEAHPGRFIALAMVPLWDPKVAAAEAERAIGRGARGVIFSENAADLGLPSIHDRGRHWDPLLQVANDTGLPICMHIGSSSKLVTTAADAPGIMPFALTPLNAVRTLADWIFSGIFFRFPNLKIMLSEGEIGWIPFLLDWLDHTAETQRWAWQTGTSVALGGGAIMNADDDQRIIVDPDRPPSALFRDHVYGCFIDDAVGVRNLDLIGVDNVMLESDYPHSDGSWPHSLELAQQQLAGLSVEDRWKIMIGNACRAFDLPVPEPAPARF